MWRCSFHTREDLGQPRADEQKEGKKGAGQPGDRGGGEAGQSRPAEEGGSARRGCIILAL